MVAKAVPAPYLTDRAIASDGGLHRSASGSRPTPRTMLARRPINCDVAPRDLPIRTAARLWLLAHRQRVAADTDSWTTVIDLAAVFRTREKEPRLIAGEALRGFSARSKGIRAHARYHHVAAIRKIIATFCPPCEAQRTLEHAALSLVPPRHRVAESAPSPEPVSDEPVDTTAPVVPLRRRSREFPAHLTREMVEHKPQDCDCPECGGRLRMN